MGSSACIYIHASEFLDESHRTNLSGTHFQHSTDVGTAICNGAAERYLCTRGFRGVGLLFSFFSSSDPDDRANRPRTHVRDRDQILHDAHLGPRVRVMAPDAPPHIYIAPSSHSDSWSCCCHFASCDMLPARLMFRRKVPAPTASVTRLIGIPWPACAVAGAC